MFAEDVGGSFGMKAGLYREDVVVLWAARRLGRPVKWTSTRSEAFLSDEHARDLVVTTELGLDAEGNFLAFRARFDNNIGAYLSGRSVPILFNVGGIAGVYRTPALAAELRGVFSNTAQTGPYRGAGRPEATYVLERTIDIAAREIGADPFALRQQNLIPPEAMPFQTPLIFKYDCGEFAANMEVAARLVDHDGLAARREEARSRGKLHRLRHRQPDRGGGWAVCAATRDSSRLTVAPDGSILLECGSMSTGQGLETSMPEIAAASLGIDPSRITYRGGSSDALAVAARQRRLKRNRRRRRGGLQGGRGADRDGARARRRHPGGVGGGYRIFVGDTARRRHRPRGDAAGAGLRRASRRAGRATSTRSRRRRSSTPIS